MKHTRRDYDRIQDPKNLIPQDEPVFLLRGQDVAAPGAVRAWADLNEVAGGDREMTISALKQAHDMEAWQAEHGKKSADVPNVVLTLDKKAEVEYWLSFGCKVKITARELGLPEWVVKVISNARGAEREEYDDEDRWLY